MGIVRQRPCFGSRGLFWGRRPFLASQRRRSSLNTVSPSPSLQAGHLQLQTSDRVAQFASSLARLANRAAPRVSRAAFTPALVVLFPRCLPSSHRFGPHPSGGCAWMVVATAIRCPAHSSRAANTAARLPCSAACLIPTSLALEATHPSRWTWTLPTSTRRPCLSTLRHRRRMTLEWICGLVCPGAPSALSVPSLPC